MSSIDYLILGIIFVSVAIGIWRGFVREALSLLVWVAAFWLAYTFAATLELYFTNLVADQALRLAVSFIVLFLAVHIVGFFVSRLIATVVRSIGLKSVDRVVGAGFGLARGVVVIAVLLLLVDLTPIKEEALWQQSVMVSMFSDMLQWFDMHYPLDELGEAFVATGNGLF